MPGSRFLNPLTPGFLLSTIQGLLDADETLVVQAITAGSYFHVNETPTGTINGTNDTFVLSDTPNPVLSLDVKLNGVQMTAVEDYVLTGDTIVFVTPPPSGSILRVSFTVSPV